MRTTKKRLQAIYDRVKKFMIKQGHKSWQPGEGCRYRQGELKCAIGCLIPDSKYRTVFEGRALVLNEKGNTDAASQPHLDRAILAAAGLKEGREALLAAELQNNHDEACDSAFVTDFLKRAEETAVEFGLKP